jgi:hypothetical protein
MYLPIILFLLTTCVVGSISFVCKAIFSLSIKITFSIQYSSFPVLLSLIIIKSLISKLSTLLVQTTVSLSYCQ